MENIDTFEVIENDSFFQTARKIYCPRDIKPTWNLIFATAKTGSALSEEDEAGIEELRLFWEEKIENYVNDFSLDILKKTLYLAFWTATDSRSVASPLDFGFGVIFDALFQVCRRRGITF